MMSKILRSAQKDKWKIHTLYVRTERETDT